MKIIKISTYVSSKIKGGFPLLGWLLIVAIGLAIGYALHG